MSAQANAVIAVGAAVLLLAKKASARTLQRIADDAAHERGANAAIMSAIIDTEQGGPAAWKASSVNDGPDDSRRGGAWGAPQITYLTALDVAKRAPDLQARWRELSAELSALGPVRELEPAALLDPELQMGLCACFVAELQRYSGPTNAPSWPDEIASRYNSGQGLSTAPARTLGIYLPRFRRFYAARTSAPGA